jgi:flagellar M-ring protein FliF
MLEGSVDSLEGESVQGMAQLVASSVKGLKTSNVTITDPSGRMLWPQGDDATGGAAGATKQAAEGRYERQLEAGLDAMLARTLGPGKAQVVVNADLNVDKTTRKELVYAKKGTPLKTQEETERLEGGAAGAGGVAGTAGNIPSYAQNATGGGNSNYERETRTTDLGVNKTVSETVVAPGEVQGLKVSLLVDKSVDPAVFASLQNVVANAAGVDTARGDAIEAAQVAFAPAPEAPKAGPVPVTLLGPLKWGGLVIATLVFLFLMWRTLRRREAGTLPQPAWLTEIEKPTPLSEIEAARQQPTQIVVPDREPNFQLQTMEELMEREPDRVAQQVKAWMAED